MGLQYPVLYWNDYKISGMHASWPESGLMCGSLHINQVQMLLLGARESKVNTLLKALENIKISVN